LNVSMNVASMGPEDMVVILAGTNDISRNDSKGFLSRLRKTLQVLSHTNVLLFNIPHRFDLIPESCVNTEVAKVNQKLSQICNHFRNVTLVDISRIGRRFHTHHGLHFNFLGKRLLCDTIINAVQNIDLCNYKTPIVLPLVNQENWIA
jgi:lysophospholipase L1-like esterase